MLFMKYVSNNEVVHQRVFRTKRSVVSYDHATFVSVLCEGMTAYSCSNVRYKLI